MYRLLAFLLSFSLSCFAVDFVLFTQPKTGTHLLTPILSALTGKEPYCPRGYMKQSSWGYGSFSDAKLLEEGFWCPNRIVEEIWQLNERQGSFLHFHTPYTKELEQYLREKMHLVFFVKRDPRDQIVSLLNHYKKFGFLDENVKKFKTDHDRLIYLIRHHMKHNLDLFKGWLSSPICCVLDFNKLMGSHGGAASDEEALQEIRKMSSFLDIKISDEELWAFYLQHFGKGEAFFSGKAGSWRSYFSELHKVLVKREIGQLLIELGFEKDLNW